MGTTNQETTSLVPATQSTLPAGSARPATDLSLYALQDELAQMVLLREEMEGQPEDTTALDEEIAKYHQDLIPRKVDNIVHILKTFRVLKLAAEEEEKRLKARKLRFDNAYKRLASYIEYVLWRINPKQGKPRRLEGHVGSLALARNGGQEALRITDESLVPNEYCEYVVRFSLSEYQQALELMGTESIKNRTREVNKDQLRQALSMRCAVCSGTGSAPDGTKCPRCGQTGYAQIAGAHLERGWHVNIG